MEYSKLVCVTLSPLWRTDLIELNAGENEAVRNNSLYNATLCKMVRNPTTATTHTI